MSELGSLLGRWHQWRAGYSHERKLTRVAGFAQEDTDDADWLLERSLMALVDEEVQRMPRELQLALQHVARRECMGVEVMFNPRLPAATLDELCSQGTRELERRLRRVGVL